jgi:hypothetical protein
VTDLNPQAEQVADASMVRNLDALAQAIWPQERELFMGRNTFSILDAMHLDAITVDFVVADTVRVPRETFASGRWRTLIRCWPTSATHTGARCGWFRW